MGVEQNGRGALDAGRMRNERGLALGPILSGFAQDLGIQTKGRKALTNMLGAALHVGGVRRIRRHRRNRNELREFLQQRRESSLQALPQNGRRQCV